MLKWLKKTNNYTTTQNKALAYKSSNSAVLDLFALGGSSRNMDKEELTKMISRALNEDFNLGLRVIAYISDIRGGLGERDFFKLALKTIGNFYPDTLKKILSLVPEYGRWDYLYEFVDTKFHDDVFELIRKENKKCIEDGTTSLLYKWLKSINSSSTITKKLGLLTAKELNLTPEQYRKLLSKKREELKVVERYMSANEWSKINYEHVPSKASLIYRQAFLNHDEERYNDFINNINKGEMKINTSTLYPHDILTKYNVMQWGMREIDMTLETMWDNLPNYVEGKKDNIISVIDVSGSMQCVISPKGRTKAIDVAIGLGLYFAERIEGVFKNHFITFSASPELVEIKGESLAQKVFNISRAKWGMNTNIEKVFNLILNTALRYKLPQDELPSKILIVSDMQFDCVSGGNTPFIKFKQKFEKQGYKLPQLVFWQVNALSKQTPVLFDDNNTALVSGYSPINLKFILDSELITPFDLMIKTLMQPRYDLIVNMVSNV